MPFKACIVLILVCIAAACKDSSTGPDILPVVMVRASNADDRAIVYVNGVNTAETSWGKGPGNTDIGHKAGDTGWVDVSKYIKKGENAFRFWVWNGAYCCGVSGTFEIKVEKEIKITRTFEKTDSTEGVKYDETVRLIF
jgi:hypothetical protein